MNASRLTLPALTALLLLPTFQPGATAETVKDREGAVRGDKAALAQDARWLYNEIDHGFTQAKQSGKPLLVVLRCVPCLACMGMDASVLNSKDLAPLLDQFVCVRVINANALDLRRFQFDYDLSFSALFFHGDGTLYARFGSWRHQKNSQETDTAGFRQALEGVLRLHRAYPANKAELAGKQPGPTPFESPLEIPGLVGKYGRELDWGGKVVQSCVHCHMIGDALRTHARNQGQPVPEEWIYPQPQPETIGLRLAPDRAATVAAVLPNSPAAAAGLQSGDDLLTLAGQPVVSMADVSWVLHRTANTAVLPITYLRSGTSKTARLELPAQWRYRSDISRRVGTWGMRAMALGGLQLVDLTDDERRDRKLPTDTLALLILHAGEYGNHAAAKKAGFQKGDVIVELDGSRSRATESEWIGRLLRDHRPGESLPARVLRGDQQIDLRLPMQ
ncbi:MAG: PDZ domain-containing protein [Verrucomicrobiales bacterium]|nr:PDZ domain-containing protein [Verrucomicrobiales bacterium]